MCFQLSCPAKSQWLQDKCPGTLVFVLKELDPENWINGGGNFTVVLRQPDSSSIVRKVRRAR